MFGQKNASAQEVVQASFTRISCPFGVMAQMQYTWNRRVGFWHLLKRIDGAKLDAFAAKRKGDSFPFAKTSTICAKEVVIILRQSYLAGNSKKE